VLWSIYLYFLVSFLLFLATANTIPGWLAYFLLLLPFYILVGALWPFLGPKRNYRPVLWFWGIILGLQAMTMLAAPGDCYGWKQGSLCKSNFQVWLGKGSATDDWAGGLFIPLLATYAVAVVIALWGGQRQPTKP
jgi:hypothetical protein